MAERWTSRSEAETEELGARLGRRLLARAAPEERVVLLVGEMGAGKTVVARGIARSLGIDPREVQSPTFTLVHHLRGAGGAELFHLDLYRLSAEEVDGLGLDEILAGPGVKVVEWAERMIDPPPGALRLVIRNLGTGRRELELTAGRDPAEERSRG